MQETLCCFPWSPFSFHSIQKFRIRSRLSLSFSLFFYSAVPTHLSLRSQLIVSCVVVVFSFPLYFFSIPISIHIHNCYLIGSQLFKSLQASFYLYFFLCFRQGALCQHQLVFFSVSVPISSSNFLYSEKKRFNAKESTPQRNELNTCIPSLF